MKKRQRAIVEDARDILYKEGFGAIYDGHEAKTFWDAVAAIDSALEIMPMSAIPATPLKGQIDEVEVYPDHALTPEEVAAKFEERQQR